MLVFKSAIALLALTVIIYDNTVNKNKIEEDEDK